MLVLVNCMSIAFLCCCFFHYLVYYIVLPFTVNKDEYISSVDEDVRRLHLY